MGVWFARARWSLLCWPLFDLGLDITAAPRTTILLATVSQSSDFKIGDLSYLQHLKDTLTQKGQMLFQNQNP